MGKQKLSFTVENVDLIEDNPNSRFSILSLDFFASGKNLNETFISEETLLRTANSIKNVPIVWKYDPVLDDAWTHTNDEIACGFIPQESEITHRELPDGRTMLNTKCLVWKKFSGKILDFFKRDGNKPISVEISVNDSKEIGNGLTELLDYVYEAVTVLGSLITPAIPLAKATVLQFAKEYEEDFQKEFSSRYDSIDFTIPENIKNNAKDTLEKYKNNGKGTSVTLAMGRFLSKNEKITPDKIRAIYKFFQRNPEDEFFIGLYGGKEAALWSKEIVEKMDKLDSEHVSYFNGNGNNGGEENMDAILTFPYKTMKDVNPAIKGIDPPVTLGQANEIAKAADAIGTDESKNGWAIAIAQFKKNHKVENGHWVKKEKMADDEDNVDKEFAKEDLGKGNALKVNKSKEAMSEKAWGEVDKTALRNKVLNASNYKSLVSDVYALAEAGWEDAPSEHLKYPIMELKGDTLVYNRYGLSAALQRAKGQNETAVVSKVKGIYKKMGLEDPDKKNSMALEKDNYLRMEDKNIVKKKKDNKFSADEKVMQALMSFFGTYTYGEADDSKAKYEVKDADKDFAYVEDKEDGKKYKVPYTIGEDGVPMCNMDAKEENPDEEPDDDPDDEGNEDEEDNAVKMSLNEYLDVAALLEFLKNETVVYRSMKSDAAKDIRYSIANCMNEIAKGLDAQPKAILSAMFSFMKVASKELASLSEKNKVFSEENIQLKEFKTTVETEKKQYEVDKVLKEAEAAGMPEAEIDACRTDALSFSLENIEAYKNMVKAKAFKYFGTRDISKDSLTRIGLPFNGKRFTKPSPWK